MRQGRLLVISAPSGTGKTTLVARLVNELSDIVASISYTSRQPGPGEQNGLHYTYVDRAQFEGMIARDEFLEWADVFGNYYGTGKARTEKLLASGLDVVLVIDVQGAQQVRSQRPDAILIFLLPPSYAALERRLRGRSRDGDEAILRRLATAREEVDHFRKYDYVVVNDDIGPCVDRLKSIIVAERSRRDAMTADAEAIVATFRGK
jgi:guanylate kinase